MRRLVLILIASWALLSGARPATCLAAPACCEGEGSRDTCDDGKPQHHGKPQPAPACACCATAWTAVLAPPIRLPSPKTTTHAFTDARVFNPSPAPREILHVPKLPAVVAG